MLSKLITYRSLRIQIIMLIICIIGMLYSNNSLKAQAIQFSQFYAAPMYLAPSFAGSTDGSRIILNYRNQWPQLPGTFQTFAFSVDHYFHDYRSGVGFQVFRDQAGSGNLATTNAGVLYSYNFRANRHWTLRPGVHFLYSQRSIDYNRLIFGDQLDLDNDGLPNSSSRASISLDSRQYFDASASIIAYRGNLWIGTTVDHLMRPDQSMTSQASHIPLKFSAFGGYRIMLNQPLAGVGRETISIAYLYKNQGPFNQLDLGAYWTKEPISIGFLYRGVPVFDNDAVNSFFNRDAVVLMAAIRTNDVRIGYSYDFTISNLLGSTGGSHEISIIYEFNQGRPQKVYEAIPCPTCANPLMN